MQYLLRVRIVVAMLALTSTSLLAQDFLSEFVEVTTRPHVDSKLGFSLEYPYEWEPSANPLAESDFYVGAPFAMPSFSLTVSDIPAGQELVNSLASLNLFVSVDGKAVQSPKHVSVTSPTRSITTEQIEFNGHDAMKGVTRWTTEDAGRHFIETTVISLYANDRWYQLTINQSYRETQWRPRLQAILDSFQVLEAES